LKTLNQAGHEAAQCGGQRTAFFINIQHVKRALFILFHAQTICRVETIGAQKTLNGFFRRIDTRAFALLFAIRQVLRQTGGQQRDALRRDMRGQALRLNCSAAAACMPAGISSE
jgi:hypothetical protein